MFTTDFLKSTQVPNFMKFRPIGAEFFHANRRTDKTMLIAVFRNFGDAPINKLLENFFTENSPNTKFSRETLLTRKQLFQRAVRNDVNETERTPVCQSRLPVYVRPSTSASTAGQTYQCLGIFDFQPH